MDGYAPEQLRNCGADDQTHRNVHSGEPLPADIVCASDYIGHARYRLDPALLAYVDGGSGEQLTLDANRDAFRQIGLYNRVLSDCAHGSTATRLLGRPLRHPILLAPVALQRMLHADGELAVARAAAATDTPMVVSTLASCTLEAIADEGPEPWLQLYLQPRRAANEALLERAVRAGYRAIVVTLDAPVQSPNRAALRLGFKVPSGVRAVNLPADTPIPQPGPEGSRIFQGLMARAPRWQDLAWLLDASPLPVLAKGVSHPDDAEALLRLGVAGIVVSNHGGRALDGLPASLALLPAIRARVGAHYPLLLDGGIRSGSDVFKALALGANAVLVGRLQVHALAVAGALGVAHMLKLLREELELTMALTGAASIADIAPSRLHFPPGCGIPRCC
ncbi:MAG: alpha-hydroxy acid oxidase [Lysobacterales bacterium]